MGVFGTIMAGTAIEEALENVYGPNAVKQLLACKAVSHANRAHMLAGSAQTIKLQGMALAKNGNEVTLEEIKYLYDKVVSKTGTCETEIPSLESLCSLVEETKNSLLDQSHTARLRLQYVA